MKVRRNDGFGMLAFGFRLWNFCDLEFLLWKFCPGICLYDGMVLRAAIVWQLQT
jgi:hypothetical protein